MTDLDDAGMPDGFTHAVRVVTPPAERALWRGSVGPAIGTPERRPDSVRRTTSIDMIRPDGLWGPLVLRGRGRDLHTDSDGHAHSLDAGRTEVEIDFIDRRSIRSVETMPPNPRTDELLGLPAASGFRAAVAAALPADRADETIVHQLLDDVPVSTLISGAVYARHGFHLPHHEEPHKLPWSGTCAGWAADAAMTLDALRTGVPSYVGEGPPAPSFTTDDPQAWHAMDALPVSSYRRLRRVDATVDDGGAVDIDVFFRDSYIEDDGSETVVHEYSLRAASDIDTLIVGAAGASPHVLPGPDCINALQSAERIGGLPLDQLRQIVGDEFSGVTTCTHLNDMLRSLSALPGMLERAGLRQTSA